MKDAKGHGSDPRGGPTAHASAVNKVGVGPLHRMVQELKDRHMVRLPKVQ